MWGHDATTQGGEPLHFIYRLTRTSQIVFGERQHLPRVLDSLEGTEMSLLRLQQERRVLEELLHARTRELNQINTAWTRKSAWC